MSLVPTFFYCEAQRAGPRKAQTQTLKYFLRKEDAHAGTRWPFLAPACEFARIEQRKKLDRCGLVLLPKIWRLSKKRQRKRGTKHTDKKRAATHKRIKNYFYFLGCRLCVRPRSCESLFFEHATMTRAYNIKTDRLPLGEIEHTRRQPQRDGAGPCDPTKKKERE
jgi:hypothetical protein